ncbi:hypothetical protein IP88_00605 [alpha proteobacterium AAP81b]|nr:hypothetical protein IP88_00605 [alpha proteobacterium AAP81b]
MVAAEVRARDRDIWLAIHYAPAAARPGLFALFGLDLELRHVVATTSEAMIGEIRLAWWREALQGLDAGRVPAQPLLQLATSTLLPAGVRGAELADLEDRWLGLIGSDTLPQAHIDGGGALFALAARLTGGDADTARQLGRHWAGDPGPLPSVAAPLRPLLGLALLARRDPAEPRGSLGRQWRLLRAVATGR